MSNQFFEPGEGRAARVKELFAKIAPRYDLINDVQSFGLHRYWKMKVLALARPAPHERALDICCGTGDLAARIAHRGARVIGLDFSEQMLKVAENRRVQLAARIKPRGQIQSLSVTGFVQGDALRLPFPDRIFDVVTIAYGLRNLADLKGGLAEMYRVARPGGRLLVLDFGKPENVVWRGAYFAYLKMFVPVLGRIFCGNASAYAYILESLKHYPAQRGVADQMTALGLTKVQIINFLGGVMSIHYAQVGPALSSDRDRPSPA